MSKMFLVCICLSLPLAASAQDWDQYQVTSTHVAGTVHMLKGAGGNLGVSAGADGIILVDDQFAPMAEKIQTALDAINPGPLHFVLNTHFHGDHTGGNEIFGAKAPLVSHINVRERLSKEVTIRGNPTGPQPEAAWPVVTFDSNINFYFNDEHIEVIHFPNAHTDGDAVVFFTTSNVIHMGDIFFAAQLPFIDLDNGGSLQGVLAAVEAALGRCDENTKVIPGHGDLTDRTGLERYRKMLLDSVQQVKAWKEEGKTHQEIKGLSLGSEYESWASRFIPMDVWLDTVYKGL